MPRATIADVAQRAGVTKSTVSHALSGKRPVAPETRLRIEQAIASLGYTPNPIAQRLAVGRSRTVGFVYPLYAPQITGLEMKFIAAAATAVSQAGYAFVLLTEAEGRDVTLEQFFESGLLDGVILMQVRMHDVRVDALRQAELPFVLVGRTADNTGLSFIDLDVEVAITQCVTHLAELGHRHIAYLRQDLPDFGFAVRALRSFEAACAARGLSVLAPTCGLSPEGGRQAMAALLQEHPDTTGVIVWNDLAAWGALQAVSATGRRVPEDVSLICFDHATISNLVPFRPTTIDTRPEEMSAQAVHMLLGLLDREPTEAEGVLMAPRLVVGDTTAAPPSLLPAPT